MPQNEVTRVNRALETFEKVRAVNCLIQGLCTRMDGQELTEIEAEGLYVVLEWQNFQMQQAEAVIKTVCGAAPLKVA